jgi:intracellular sulfur oxidation DsrE/DsrF family protein
MVREDIDSYEDPGPYDFPEGTVARPARREELRSDGIDVPPTPKRSLMLYRQDRGMHGEMNMNDVKRKQMMQACKNTLLLTVCALALGCGPTKEPTVTEHGWQVTSLARKNDIRVVYQINTDGSKKGLHAGLFHVRKLINQYDKAGIPTDERQVHAVLHGDAAYHLLRDRPWAKAAGRDGPNPNRDLVAELLRRDVSVEICAQTMDAKGWVPDDLLDGVEIVVGAFPRIIDLQHRGFAYIRY